MLIINILSRRGEIEGMDRELFKKAGLTDGETRVYFALMGLGSSTVGPIVEKSGVSRSIIYKILDGLVEKGLCSYITKEKTKYYQPESPERILDYMDGRRKELEKNRKMIEKILPNLWSISKAEDNEVRVYRGFRGIISVHTHTYRKLNRGDEYYYLGIAHDQEKFQHAYWKKDHKRREKAGIKCRLLFDSITPDNVLVNRNSYKRCEARHMPINMRTPAAFMGYKDVVAIIMLLKNPMAIEIVNKEIARMFWDYFEQFWEMSKPFRAKKS